MIKMAVFDMDGTLLLKDKTLSVKSIEAIKYLLSKNVKVIIATGRPNTLLKEYVNKLNINEFSVTCNGSVIYNHKNSEFLYNDTINKATTKNIESYLLDNNIDFLAYEKDYVVSHNSGPRHLFYTDRNKTLPIEDQAQFYTFEDIKKPIDELSINKILVVEQNKEKYAKTVEFLNKFDNLYVTQSKEDFIDVGPTGNSKGNALDILCKYYNIDKSEVIAFGDQMNDVSMLKFAGIGVAMGNAKQAVKDASDQVTLSNEEDGVFHKISEIYNL